jgi:hypothetical protein
MLARQAGAHFVDNEIYGNARDDDLGGTTIAGKHYFNPTFRILGNAVGIAHTWGRNNHHR